MKYAHVLLNSFINLSFLNFGFLVQIIKDFQANVARLKVRTWSLVMLSPVKFFVNVWSDSSTTAVLQTLLMLPSKKFVLVQLDHLSALMVCVFNLNSYLP